MLLNRKDGTNPGKTYSDIVLAAGIIAIVSVMILPLPLIFIDILVAINILLGVGLVLLAIYIPSATAFSSFPSVILLTTLFRLSLSIATTRLILLNANGGDIIATFGEIVVGGNMVVGIVVFLIITVVQFIVIAKGAERVAEVSARFTLDAMPGKQLSIDSDLRSGLLDKDQAREKRKELEVESQLHGAMDGAMKFVKGDAIAGIVILLVNILGGLTIGVLQRDLGFGEAIGIYSILTIGDGLVAQIPALLTSISAGLIITRTASADKTSHLGTSIQSQIGNHPRVISIAGVLSFGLALVPGFPWWVFIFLGTVLILLSLSKTDGKSGQWLKGIFSSDNETQNSIESTKPKPPTVLTPPSPIVLKINNAKLSDHNQRLLEYRLVETVNCLRETYGAPIPSISVEFHSTDANAEIYLTIFDIDALSKTIENTTENIIDLVICEVHQTIEKDLGVFLGIQEVSNLLTSWNRDYPDLIKETLRSVTPHKLTDILKRLLSEGISIRNLRDIFEAILESAQREKDSTQIVELVRQTLKQKITSLYTDSDKQLNAVLVHPDLEEKIRASAKDVSRGSQFELPPEEFEQLISTLKQCIDSLTKSVKPVVLCTADVRRHLRKLIEDDYAWLPVVSYQELTGNVKIQPIAKIGS